MPTKSEQYAILDDCYHRAIQRILEKQAKREKLRSLIKPYVPKIETEAELSGIKTA